MTASRGSVVVIGAGLGGISAAVSLATAGFAVEVFEKNAQLGGKLNFLHKEGFSFDLGPSIIILPHLFRRLFERAGRRMEDYVQFEELQPQWRSFWEDGTRVDLHPDMRRMERELEQFGAQAAGYWEFLEYSRTLFKFAEEAYLERGADTLLEVLRGHRLSAAAQKIDPLRSMDAGVGRFVREPHLRDLLDFFIKYVGSSPFDAPALMNLLPYSQLGYGLWYVTGGMYNLARGLGRLMDELGVKVHLGREVRQIRKGDGRVQGVILDDGSAHDADFVVSNMEVIPAYERLLGERGGMMRRYRWMYEPACSGLVIHLGVDHSYPQLQHHNFFFARELRAHMDTIHRKHELPEDPTLYVVCPSRSDPGLAPAGHEIIKILPHLPHLGQRRPEPQEYLALEQRVLDKLERMGLAGLRSHIVVRDVLTPVDLERMYYSNQGAIYGVVADRQRNMSLKAPKRSARYANLYFVGGSVNPGGGTPMVVLSGQHVARMISESV